MQAWQPSWAGLWSQLGLLIGFAILKVNKKQSWAHTRAQPPGSILIADETQLLVNSELQIQSCSQPTMWGITWIPSGCTRSLVSSDPPMDRLQTHFRHYSVTKQWRRCSGGQTEITLNCALNHSSKCWESREELKTLRTGTLQSSLLHSTNKQLHPVCWKRQQVRNLISAEKTFPSPCFEKLTFAIRSAAQGPQIRAPLQSVQSRRKDGMEKSRINWDKEHMPMALPGFMYPKST